MNSSPNERSLNSRPTLGKLACFAAERDTVEVRALSDDVGDGNGSTPANHGTGGTVFGENGLDGLP